MSAAKANAPVNTKNPRRSALVSLCLLVVGVSWFLLRMNNAYRRMKLVEAAYNGNINVVRVLLDSGVPVDGAVHIYHSPYDEQRRPLGWQDAVDELKQGGKTGETTALQQASRSGYTDIARLLLARHADPNFTPMDFSNFSKKEVPGTSPLATALQSYNTDIAKLLLENGAQVKNDTDGCYILCKAGMDWSSPPRDRGGDFSKVHPQQTRGAELTRMILARGVAADCRIQGDTSPLYRAVAGNCTDTVKELLTHGASPNVVDGGLTMLYMAVERGNREVVRLLLAAGADVNAHDTNHTTALQAAQHAKNTEIARMLLAAGAKDTP